MVAQLEATLPGCQVLLKTWGGLGGLLRSGRGWQPPDKLKAIRLMGHQPMDALSWDEVAVIFLASHVIEPQSRYAFQELRCEIPDDQFSSSRSGSKSGSWKRSRRQMPRRRGRCCLKSSTGRLNACGNLKPNISEWPISSKRFSRIS